MMSFKQEGMKYHFLSLCYDAIWNWTPVSRAIGKQPHHYANGQLWRISICLPVYNDSVDVYKSLPIRDTSLNN